MERWVVYAFLSMFFAGFTSVVAMVLAAVVLHEVLTTAKLIGCGLIVAGLLVIARGP